jgi:hypothetical protein
MTAVTPSRDALVRELHRHIGAHADIVANALIASGAVVPLDTLADDEALVSELRARLEGWFGPNLDGWPEFPDRYFGSAARFLMQCVAAVLSERGDR